MTNPIQHDWSIATEDELIRGYQDQALDTQREREALEWSEALIGDGADHEEEVDS